MVGINNTCYVPENDLIMSNTLEIHYTKPPSIRHSKRSPFFLSMLIIGGLK